MTTLQERLEASERPPALPRVWTGERIAGNVVLAFWFAAGILMVWYLVEAWAPEKVARYGPKYISGLLTTLSLVGLSLVIGAVLSIPVAIGRMSKNKLISRIAFAYVYVFRGTPLIAQLFLIYYGLGSFRPQLEAVGLWGFF
ncbi:MAG: ABC transporter permease subunit, partial [Nitratireductor sp.]